MKKIRCVAFCLISFFVINTNVFSQVTIENSTKNPIARRTALRCLELSKSYFLNNEINASLSQTEMGLSYDDSVSDLWYLKALALRETGDIKKNAIECLDKAFLNDTWLSYNRDAGRLLYASLLSDTGNAQKALDLLSEKPVIYSSEAEYTRAISAYRTGNYRLARSIISSAKSVYPNDVRFVVLFFKWESKNEFLQDSDFSELLAQLQALKDNWINSKEAILYSSFFVEEDERIRLLRQYAVDGIDNPDYILPSLQLNLITEPEAVDLLFKFANNSIAYSIFDALARVINTDEVKFIFNKSCKEFSGSFSVDTDNDLIENLFISYKYGRPEVISFDKNQDGFIDWQMNCDYGTPVKFTDNLSNRVFSYSSFPYVLRIENQDTKTETSLIMNSLEFTPVEFVNNEYFDNCSLYTVSIKEKLTIPEIKDIWNSINTTQYFNKMGYEIRSSIRNGKLKTATYSIDGTPFAYAIFEDGIPLFRNLDADRDGYYEITEVYECDIEKAKIYQTEEEKTQLYELIYGSVPSVEGVYLSQIISDRDKNSIHDYKQEILPNGGEVCSWDEDEDGEWETIYSKEVDNETNDVKECSTFIHPLKKTLIKVEYKNGIPVLVSEGEIQHQIVKDAIYDFYWIGKVMNSEIAESIIKEIDKTKAQGVFVIISSNFSPMTKITAIKIGKFYFGDVFNE